MINKQKIYGLLGICAKAGKIVFGTDACIDSIDKKKVSLVLIAQDASDRTKRNFEYICNNNSISITIFGSIEEISKSIGKNNKAVIAIKDKNLSNEIIKIINGGEIIG